MVELGGNLNRCPGQLERGNREIFFSGERNPAGTLLGSNIGSDRLTVQYLDLDSCIR
jgi:hypothetical protein